VADRRLTRQQILAFRAGAHGLAERRPAKHLLDVVRACGVQDTPPGSADVALAARLDITAPTAAALVTDKTLALTWSVRGAPHLLAPDDLAVFTLGARPADGTLASLWRQPEASLGIVERAMVATLKTKPKTKGEVSGAVAAAEPDHAPWCRACDVHHPNESVFRAAPLLGRMVLTSTAPVVLTRTKTWLGSEPTGDVDALRTELLLRYLHCYAPTTSGHFAEWAGIAKSDAKQRWAAVADALVKVGSAFVLEEDLDSLERPAPVEGVRLIPNKDAFLQARDRDVLFPEPTTRKRVFPMLGGPGVVLVDGVPAGTWRGAAKGKRYDVTVDPFGKLTRSTLALIKSEAERVACVRGHDTATVTIQ
jgi:hypothetical protein